MYEPPTADILIKDQKPSLPIMGLTMFGGFWISIYALILIWGYFSNIHWRQEYPDLANTEFHPLRIALNETIAMAPLLALEPWFGFRLGETVASQAKKFWGTVFALALFMGLAEGVWVILVDIARRWVTGHATGNEPSWALMAVSFFALTFLVSAAVHCLLGGILRFRWGRLPNPPLNSDPPATVS